ncbi:fungal-specific transcription factor domain-containing protein [Xylaria nigripes]|nr:fungal-specific transcription factor domain-containing protein [Xylaria nigripes]
MTISTTRGPVHGVEMDVSDQGNVSQSASASRRSNQQHVRHRASIACFSCRDRRIRCVVPKGASACIQCKRSGTNCVIKMDDERRRPVSKAYVSSLSARISLLEGMLREHDVVVPPATHPPMTKHEAPQSTNSTEEIRIPTIDARAAWSQSDANSPIRHVLSPPDSHHDFMQESPIESGVVNADVLNLESESARKDISQYQALGHVKPAENVQQLFSPNGGLSYDRLLGKFRFFDPVASNHLYASPDRNDSRESAEQIRRAERVIRSLTPKTHDYLMQNFWKYYNSVLQVVDRVAFEADRGSETPKFYSSFLHVIILAVGWRFADQDRCDIARMNLGNGKSTLHREARYMIDLEFERAMGITSVQSLLILGDLEYGAGRENMGWMYTGMAGRLAFDIGLHVDYSNLALQKHEVSIQRKVMKACVFQDRYWALYLGRSANIKVGDIAWDLSKSSLSNPRSFEPNHGIPVDSQTSEDETYEKLFELLDLAGGIIEGRDEIRRSHASNQTALFGSDKAENNISSRALKLDRQLENWYDCLPGNLTWKAENIRTAPSSFFLLHGQYHAIRILLHRSREILAAYNDKLRPRTPTNLGGAMNAPETGYDFTSNQEINSHDPTALTPESIRDICTREAVQLAQVLSQYRQRYDLEKMCWINLQPAGTASMALLAALSYSKDEIERRNNLSCLKVLVDTIYSMSRLYKPASRVSSLVHSILTQLHLDARELRQDRGVSFAQGANDGGKDMAGQQYQPQTDAFSFLPVRRESYNNGDESMRNKRRRTAQISFTSASAGPLPPFHVPPSPSYTQPAYAHHSNSMPSIFSASSEPSDTFFNMDSLWNTGMNTDNAYPGRASLDTYLRVAPSAKGWALQSLHAASQYVQSHNSSTFDSHMPSDWMAGSTGFGAPTSFQGPGLDTAQLAPGPGGKDPWGCKREDASGLVWMGGAQGAEQAVSAPEAPRKHELDFLCL